MIMYSVSDRKDCIGIKYSYIDTIKERFCDINILTLHNL